MAVKRFMLFGCNESYYPSGGMSDFLGDFDTETEAKEKARNFEYTPSEDDLNQPHRIVRLTNQGNNTLPLMWWHIFDTQEHKVTFQFGEAYCQKLMTLNNENCEDTEIEIPYGLRVEN
jgi:hypothetical protein